MFTYEPEIDLGDYPLGYTEPQEDTYYPQRKSEVVYYQYKFETYEALATSEVFQKALSEALAFKNKEINSLRNEIISINIDSDV